MLLILKREQIESSRLRALAQAIVNKEKGPEAFDEFRKTAFPWIEGQKKRDAQDHIKILAEEVKRGSISITPMQDNTKQIRSRMKTRVIQTTAAEPIRRSTPEERRLYQKMGSLVPR